ncbi:MAG TPA: transporter, partial [Armatimonadota bacterium]|nr:transporter [Armatimonadota bacterium]
LLRPTQRRVLLWLAAVVVCSGGAPRGVSAQNRPLHPVVPQLAAAQQGAAGNKSPGEEARKGTPELLTDRPDFTESSFVVPLHSLQLEAGFTYTDEAGGAGQVFNVPELLLRYGFGRRTELRVGVPDFTRSRLAGGRGSDFGDLYLGIKHQLGPTDAKYGFALIPAVTLPTGGRRVSSGAVDPEMVVTWSKDLSERWAVGGILGFGLPTVDGERSFNFFPAVSFGRSISARWGTFFEWAAEFPEGGGSSQLLHHGYTYALTPVSQLDLHFGFGITRAAPDFFIGAGYAVRF